MSLAELSRFWRPQHNKFPSKDKILHAYMHSDALTDHEYTYSCVKSGYHPAVVVMDLHKKAAFNMTGRSYQN